MISENHSNVLCKFPFSFVASLDMKANRIQWWIHARNAISGQCNLFFTRAICLNVSQEPTTHKLSHKQLSKKYEVNLWVKQVFFSLLVKNLVTKIDKTMSRFLWTNPLTLKQLLQTLIPISLSSSFNYIYVGLSHRYSMKQPYTASLLIQSSNRLKLGISRLMR